MNLRTSLAVGLGSAAVVWAVVGTLWGWRQILQADADRVATLTATLETLVIEPPDSASRAMLVAALQEAGERYRHVDAGGGKPLVDIHQDRLRRIATVVADPAFSGSATVIAAAMRLQEILDASW